MTNTVVDIIKIDLIYNLSLSENEIGSNILHKVLQQMKTTTLKSLNVSN